MILCCYQPKLDFRFLGAAALPCLMALKGLHAAKQIPAIYSYHPVFIACLSQVLLPRRCCSQIRNLPPALEQLLHLGGTPAVGEDGAARAEQLQPGRSQLSVPSAGVCPSCWHRLLPSVRLNYPSRRSEMSFGVHPENFALM